MGGKPIKFGQCKGPIVTVPVPAAASQAFKHLSGCFVKLDSSERADIAEAADTQIYGWALAGELTTSSTAGQTILTVNISTEAVYLMPLDAARTVAQLQDLVGKTCDIVFAGGIQYADYDASTTDVLQIVGYEYWGSAANEQGVWVRINPTKAFAAGVV